MSQTYDPIIRNIAEEPWQEFPNHFGSALSKALIHPDTTGSRQLDYRISTYAPMAYVARHAHKDRNRFIMCWTGKVSWRSTTPAGWSASTT